MRIIEVLPFTKGKGAETLSYFSSKEIKEGTIVSIPIRGKSALGLVVGSKSASDSKTDLKTSSYRLRKVGAIVGESIFSNSFIEASYLVSDFYISSPGEIMNEVVPQIVFTNYKEFKSSKSKKKESTSSLKKEKFIFQRDKIERMDQYKTLIRTEFARGASIFICLPTQEDINVYVKELERGIEKYVYSFHSGLSKKEFIKQYNKVIEEKHPVLIVGTPHYLFISRDDIETLIVEHESSLAYKTFSRPYMDMRVFAEQLAIKSNQKLILADTFLSLETLTRHENKEFLEFAPLKWRMHVRHNATLLDTRKKDEKFSFISEEAEKAMKDAVSRRGNVFVYTSRKGLSSITICSDCETTLTCENCSVPLVLHGQKDGQRVFICHKCKSYLSAETACKNCGSWRMSALGYGTEVVEQELKKLFKEAEIKRFDKDSVNTHQKAKILASWFEKDKDPKKDLPKILVGTEMALYYLSKDIDTIIVASTDSLFNLPSFRINEKIFRTLLTLKTLCERSFILQTRTAEKKIFEQLLEGDILNFYRQEIEERKEFNYPPFVRIIKISITGKKPAIDDEKNKIMEFLSDYKPEGFSAFISKVKNLYRTHIVLRINPQNWTIPSINSHSVIDKELLRRLYSIPQSAIIQVEPEDLL